MTNTSRPPEDQAISNLRKVRGDLLTARLAALDTQLCLVGARVCEVDEPHVGDARIKRARQLCEIIGDAIAHTERLMFMVGNAPWHDIQH